MIAGPRDPQWYKDAIIYEVHVRAFKDSDADGIGDFRGLTEKLDYLHDLGITTVWLLPFYPSPLRDDGYDIADYYSINPIYGTLRDFKRFLAEAHRRNLRVVTELVVNHTSDQHPWFQRSRRAAPGSAWRDFYVWSEHPDKYREARIIFRDFEPSNWSWDPLAKAYFWHRFYAHQPDLNFDNPLVHKEITRVLDFWLDMGVDGLRLDAVPYLYEREGTSCENLVETHGFLKELRRHVDAKYGDRMLLAEANQWPVDAVTYFGGGTGDECHMVFHFPLMPRLFMAVRMEDRVPILDILEQTPLHPETSQWAVFLRNHDELTLEMVTDEERDYMYRVYADDIKARINMGIRRRLSPLLGSDRKRIELLHLLLFSLSGTPVLYYGDEIGMGDNIFLGDRNGVRTPMQWSSDKNAGFSRASPQALYLPIILDPEFHYEAVNVEAQERNPHSLLWWMRRVLILRKRHKAFGRGSLRFLEPENRRVLVFVRQHEGETILVIANLSRFPQPVQIDLSEFQNQVPIELFGRTRFPIITARPYFLTLSPHAALWFALEPPAARDQSLVTPGPAQKLLAVNSWEEIFLEKSRSVLETRLMAYFKRGWVSLGVNRECKSVQVRDLVRMPAGEQHFMVLYLGLEPVEGDLQEYILVTGFATGVRQARIEQRTPGIIICELRVESLQLDGLLYEAGCDPAFNRVLFEAFLRRRSFDGMQGELKFAPAGWFRAETAGESGGSELTGCHIEPQTISSIFRDKYLFKWFRLVQPGINPDLEVASFLEQRHFPHTPAIAGTLEYRRPGKAPMTLGILRQYVAHARVGYHYTLDMLGRYFERVRSAPSEGRPQQSALEPLLVLAERQPSEEVVKLIGTYFELARLLGHNTADLHMALASDGELRDFAPEPLTPFY
ncbi:MAG TPA: maltose alpha-D-glucosyltransferase, partial [Clostridia bacterium]|nr:maltose alpha-D-glucosyltransferase [Clostridia bacterium]